MKKILCGMLMVSVFLSVFSLNTSAETTVSFTIDNDTVDSTCINWQNGFDIYVTGSAHYNDDCRRALTSNTEAFYEWSKRSCMLASSKPIYVTAGYYLNNTLFTDPQAMYYIVQRDGGYLMGYVNQKTARGGWSYINYTITKNYATPGGYSVWGMSVSPSGVGTGYTGADAISIRATTY